jgi:hypothetical protein
MNHATMPASTRLMGPEPRYQKDVASMTGKPSKRIHLNLVTCHAPQAQISFKKITTETIYDML